MKLTELEPRWYVLHAGGPRVGFTFNCPHCKKQRLAVAVHDAGHRIIPEQEREAILPGYVWEITNGIDFNDITLSPSIDASNVGVCSITNGEVDAAKVGHWHGWISCGECV